MALEILVCILLHLSVMTAPGTYGLSEIEVFENENAMEINAIHADPALEQSIVQTYTPQLEFIEIWDLDSWD